MKFTLEQDYSIRIIYELCRNKGKRIDVGEISNLTGVTPLFTQKIMRKLSAANLVESKKGVKGGYMLHSDRSPKDISLYEIFLATEPDFSINACLCGEYLCTRPEVVENEGECCIQKSLSIINENFIESLKSVTFEKILNDKGEN